MHHAGQCLNDGKVDSSGRVWVGSKMLTPHPPYTPRGDSAGLQPNPEVGGRPAGGAALVVP